MEHIEDYEIHALIEKSVNMELKLTMSEVSNTAGIRAETNSEECLQWMAPPDADMPFSAIYRNIFETAKESMLEFEYSADERADFFFDGQWIGAGPERGCPERWYLGHFAFKVSPGRHVLSTRLYCFGKEWTGSAQMSVRHGLYVKEKSSLLQAWETTIETGIHFEHPFPDWGAYPRVRVDKSYSFNLLQGKGENWKKVVLFTDNRILYEPDLPQMRHREIFPDSICGPLKKFNHYACVSCHYRFRGKGRVRIRWAETPYLTEEFDQMYLKGKKGNRDGSFWVGNFDEFEVDGELEWYDYWWRAGHHTQVLTEGEIVTESHYYETGYPYPAFYPKSALEKAAFETLQACSHETLMDCPYYEQLMYIGDTRIQALCVYSVSEDHRLAEKALRLFSLSQRPDGSLLSRYPAKIEQVIPSFTIIYLLMVHDYWRFHGANSFLSEILPCARRVANYLVSNLKNGLLCLPGWNFIDWTREWKSGVPNGLETNCILNWMTIYALRKMAEIDASSDWKAIAEAMKRAVYEIYYLPEEKIFADDPEKKCFSEHAQVMALLADPDSGVQESLRRKDLVECGIGYSYYYLEACRQYGLTDLYEKRMAKYEKLLSEGLTTLPEEFENPRSDCHAWSSHVLYFSFLNRMRKQNSGFLSKEA